MKNGEGAQSAHTRRPQMDQEDACSARAGGETDSTEACAAEGGARAEPAGANEKGKEAESPRRDSESNKEGLELLNWVATEATRELQAGGIQVSQAPLADIMAELGVVCAAEDLQHLMRSDTDPEWLALLAEGLSENGEIARLPPALIIDANAFDGLPVLEAAASEEATIAACVRAEASGFAGFRGRSCRLIRPEVVEVAGDFPRGGGVGLFRVKVPAISRGDIILGARVRLAEGLKVQTCEMTLGSGRNHLTDLGEGVWGTGGLCHLTVATPFMGRPSLEVACTYELESGSWDRLLLGVALCLEIDYVCVSPKVRSALLAAPTMVLSAQAPPRVYYSGVAHDLGVSLELCGRAREAIKSLTRPPIPRARPSEVGDGRPSADALSAALGGVTLKWVGPEIPAEEIARASQNPPIPGDQYYPVYVEAQPPETTVNLRRRYPYLGYAYNNCVVCRAGAGGELQAVLRHL